MQITTLVSGMSVPKILKIPENTLGRNYCSHAITRPIRQNQEQQGRDVERLRLEIVNLPKHGAESAKSETQEYRTERDRLKFGLIVCR